MLNRLQRVFESLEKNEVRYLVIGGIAAVLYGVPRATFDLDIFIEPTRANARRLLKALDEAGLGTASLTNPEELLQNEITIFDDWVRIDAQRGRLVSNSKPRGGTASRWNIRGRSSR